MLKKHLKLILLFLFATPLAYSQVYMSPFSRFGLGDLQSQAMINYRGMGGACIAGMQDNKYSLENPATYGLMSSFTIETSVTASYYDLKTTSQRFRYPDFQVPYISLALPLDTARKWGLSAGLLPFSKSGYNSETLNDQPFNHREIYKLDGGLSKFYAGASFQVFHNLFLGGNAAYLFGNNQIQHTLIFPDSSSLYSMRKTSVTNIGDFNFDLGALYRIKLKHNYRIQLGATASLPSRLNTRQSVELVSYSGVNLSDSLFSKEDQKSDTYLPLKVGAGINVAYSDSWQIFADVSMRQWSKYYAFDVKADSFRDALSFKIGGEWVPGSDPASGKFVNYLGKVHYRLGASYSQAFFSVNGNVPADKRISFGMGFPVSRPKAKMSEYSFLDFALELGEFGDLNKNSIRRRYLMFSLGVHLFESEWFTRPKID